MSPAAGHDRFPRLLARSLAMAVALILLLAGPLPATATDWGRAVVDSALRRHPDPTTLSRWGYRFGLQLFGQYLLFQRTGERRYLEYIKAWVDSHVDAEGHIDQPLDMLDRQMPGLLLLALHHETAEPRYKRAAERVQARRSTPTRGPATAASGTPPRPKASSGPTAPSWRRRSCSSTAERSPTAVRARTRR